MKDQTYLPSIWNPAHGCPQHRTQPKKTYHYGGGVATVTTFHGCRCCVSRDEKSLAEGNINGYEIRYHVEYRTAKSEARQIELRHFLESVPF